MDAPADIQTELLRRLHEGDVRGAAHLLVVHHADEVYGLCRAMVRDPIAAEDLSQDVFGRAFSALPQFRGEASTRTWILQIARNRCIDHLRAERRQPWSGFDDPEPDTQPAEEPSVADLLSRRVDVERALGSLDEGERALVVLRFGHGLGYPELADAFGIGQGAARMRVSRAVKRMREAIEGADLDMESTATFPPPMGAPQGPPPAPAPAPPAQSAPSPPPAGAPAPRRSPAPSAPSTYGAPSHDRAAASGGAPPEAARAKRRRGGFLGRVSDALFGGRDDRDTIPAPADEGALADQASIAGAARREQETGASIERSPLHEPAPRTLRARIDALLDALDR